MSRAAWYWLIFGVVAVVLVVLLCLALSVWKDHAWIKDAIALAGSLASLAGVCIALIQIDQTNRDVDTVARIAEETQKAVEDNRYEIKRFLSFADMGHLIEIIKNAQTNIRKTDYQAAVILIQEIKDSLLRVEAEFADDLTKMNISAERNISDLSMDLGSLADFIMKDPSSTSSIDPKVIHKHLEEVREIIIKVETSIKQDKI